MYNPYMMNPMGGGMNNYWSPQRMQNAQPMGMYSQDAMQGAQKRDQMQGRVDNLQGRIGNLQEQYKAAGSDQQAGIQNRINTLQGRMGDLQGKMDAGGGANRMGMEYRRERRQAKNAGTYDPQAQGGQPEPAMMQGGFNPWGGMGGMGMGGMGFGGYGGWQSGGGMGGMGEGMFRPNGMPQMGNMVPNAPMAGQRYGGPTPMGQSYGSTAGGTAMLDSMGGPTSVPPYNPQAPAAQPQAQGGGWNPLTQATGMGNMFDTSFGRLVPSSVGNQNVFQREGDASTLYNYNPTQGWKSMTPEEYRGYGETNYADPRQFAAANPMMQQWTQRNGLIQGMQGTGAYA